MAGTVAVALGLALVVAVLVGLLAVALNADETRRRAAAGRPRHRAESVTGPRRGWCPRSACDHALLLVEIPTGETRCTCGTVLQVLGEDY